MTLHSFVSQALAILAPVVLAALPVLATWLSMQLSRHVRDTRLATLLGTVTKLVATAVANAYQTSVKAMKDPAMPGEWTAETARAVKQQVLYDIKTTAPSVISELQSLGIERVEELLGSLVEQSVVTLNAARLPPVAPENALPVVVVPPKEGSP